FVRTRKLPPPSFAVEYELVRDSSAVSPFATPGVSVQAIAAGPSALYVATIEENGGAYRARLSKVSGAGATDSLFEMPLSSPYVSVSIAMNDAGGVLFSSDGTLVRSDGTAATTVVVATGQKIGSIVATSSRFFFSETNASGQ